MENRVADYAIGAVHESKVPTSCGCFRRYSGMKIICSVPDDPQPLPLEIAYKVARSEIVALTLQEEAEIDVGLLIAKTAEKEECWIEQGPSRKLFPAP